MLTVWVKVFDHETNTRKNGNTILKQRMVRVHPALKEREALIRKQARDNSLKKNKTSESNFTDTITQSKLRLLFG